jgi:hypothetical protein
MDAWYIGPAKMHYRNYEFYTPETRGYRITNSAKFYPAYCKMPAIESGNTIQLAAQDLIIAIQNRHKQALINLTPQHTKALRQLAESFVTAAGSETPVTKEGTQSPRVITTQPVTHEGVTRNNQPMPDILTTHDESAHTPVTDQPLNNDRPHRITAKYMHSAPPLKYITQEEEDNAHWSNAATQSQLNNPEAIPYRTPQTLTGINTQALTQLTTQWHILPILHQANSGVHSVTTETMTKYEKLANDPIT